MQLNEVILEWAQPFKNTDLHGVYEKALAIMDAPDAVEQFQHLQRVEPVRERIEQYARRMSGLHEDVYEYQRLRRQLDTPGLTAEAKQLLERQLRQFKESIVQDRDRTNLYWRVDNAYQATEKIDEFEQVKRFISALSFENRTRLQDVRDVQDRFESWQRQHRRQKYSGYEKNKRYQGTGATYSNAFDSAYKRHK